MITATLNMVVREAVEWRSPPSARGDPRKGRIYYATQAATRPPTYVFFVNEAKLFGDDYKCGACWTRAALCGTHSLQACCMRAAGDGTGALACVEQLTCWLMVQAVPGAAAAGEHRTGRHADADILSHP